jgi:tetratricopeptide (TPR) repeat protein
MSLPSMPRALLASKACAGRWPLAFGVGALVAAVFAVYWPAITAGFVFDDDVLIMHNPSLDSGDALHRIWCTSENYEYLPITYTAFLIERRLWGDSASGYHLVSLILHAINALLVWQVLRQLRVPGAWLAALLFAVHPVAASSVAWISEQKNLWGLLFGLISLSCYLTFQADGKRGWYALSLIAFLAALLGKTSIVLAPVVILLCTWWQTGRIRRKDWLLTAPFFLLSLALGSVTVLFQFQRGIGDSVTPIPIGDYFERFKAAGFAIWFYLGKDLVPVHLSMVYPRWEYSQLTIWPSLAVLATGGILWRFRRSLGRTALFACGCYLAMALPILGFVKMSFMAYSRVADHFQYCALPVAMAVLGAIGVWVCRREWTAERLWLAAATLGMVVILFGVLTWQQAAVYKDSESLWTETLRQNPEAGVAHASLARVLVERGDLDGALRHYSEAARLGPENSYWRYNYGTALKDHGDAARAAVEFREVIRIEPGNVAAHNNLAQVLNELGQFKPALEHAKAAVALAPDSPQTHYNLGNSLAALGDPDRAIVEYRTAVRLGPGGPWAELGWSKALLQVDRPAEAADHAKAALKIDPNSDEAHYELGVALMDLGDADQAALQYREAIRLNPNGAGAHNNLADLLNRQHKPAEAAKHALAALQINPHFAEAHYNLGNAYAVKSLFADAVREYREAIRLRPDYPEAQANLKVVIRRESE